MDSYEEKMATPNIETEEEEQVLKTDEDHSEAHQSTLKNILSSSIAEGNVTGKQDR